MTEPTPTKYIDFRADDSKTEAEILTVADAENKIMTANDGDGVLYFIDRNGNRYRLSPNRAKVETPSGVVDGVNTDFELSQDPLGSAVIMFLDGVAQIDGFTVSGTTVTFDTAPQVTNGEATVVTTLYAFDQVLNTGVMSFNGRTDTHIVPQSGDYKVSDISPLEHVITVSAENADFTTVKDAIDSITDNDISNRYVIQVGPGVYSENNPIQGKEYVSVVGLGDLSSTRLTAANADADMFTMSGQFTVENVTVNGVSGASAYAFNHSVAGASRIARVGISDSENGVLVNNVAAGFTVDDVAITGISSPCTRGIYAQAGNVVVNNLRAPAGTVSTMVEATSSDTLLTVNSITALNASVGKGLYLRDSSRSVILNCSLALMADGIVADGGATVKVNAGSIFDVTVDGVRIDDVGTGTDVTLQSVNIEDSVGKDLNLLSSSCVVSGNAKIPIDNIAFATGAQIYATVVDLKEDDEGVSVLGEMRVGLPEKGAESVMGEGDSYTRGMLVYSDSDGTFTDITDVATSPSGSTFTFPFNGNGAYIWIASTLSDGTDFLKHGGIKMKMDSAGDAASGDFKFYYQDGTFGNTEFKAFEADSDGSYIPHADNFFETDGSVHIRYDSSLDSANWVKSDPMGIGTSYYWSVIRLTNTVTTLPVFQQIKLHSNRFEVNADGWIEYFGKSRPIAQLPFAIGEDKALSGNLGNQSLWMNEDIGSGLNENSFNATGDTIGRTFFMPQDLDTSSPIKLKFVGRSAATGTTEFTVKWDGATEGDILYTANPALAPGSRTQVVSQALTATEMSFYDFTLDVSNFVARRESGQPDVLSITIESTALGGGAFAMFAIEAEYTKWCEGGHV